MGDPSGDLDSAREYIPGLLAPEESLDNEELGDDIDGELIDDQAGDRRSGQLVWELQDSTDPSSDLFATDVGIDGAAASAEEAAIHTIPDQEDTETFY